MHMKKFFTTLIIDLILGIVVTGGFILWFYVLPKNYDTEGTVVASANTDTEQFTLPSTEGNSSEEEDSSVEEEETTTEESSSKRSKPSGNGHSFGSSDSPGTKGRGNTGSSQTSDYEADASESQEVSDSDKTRTEVESYSGDTVSYTIHKVTYGSGSDTVTYYVADLYVSNISCIQTAFADGSYGKNIKDTIANMAEENNALLAMTGDTYGSSEVGVVIRNGVLYRETSSDADVCVLYTDGTMETYSADDFDADSVIEKGAWQAWTFGPSLLDGSGNVLSSFNTNSYLNQNHPRAAIGYVEPGHYVFVVVDGRDEGYSCGVTITELATIMSEEGCMLAYNLDGGKSSAMYADGEYVNQPTDGGREVSDIIYITEASDN